MADDHEKVEKFARDSAKAKGDCNFVKKIFEKHY